MGSRILLISVNRCTAPDPVFPLGLAHLNAALRRAGHEIRWFDCQAHGAALSEILDEFQPRYVGLSQRNIDDILIGRRKTYFGDLVDLCRTLRNGSGRPIILGGSGFSIFPSETLQRTGADFGICGQGERSLVRLLEALERGAEYRDIPGLVFRQGEKIVVNPQEPDEASVELGLDDWPPELAQFYLRQSGMLSTQTQRGCGLHCGYCTYPLIEGRRHRSRSPATVARELQRLAALGAQYVFIVDSVFNSSPRHVTEICEAILEEGVRIRWGCFLRPAGLTPALVKLMARAGLAHIEFGSDSFSDSVLSQYGKGFGFDEVRESSALAQEHQIDYCHYLICGGPGETLETLETNFDNSRQLRGALILAVAGMRIYPGTALHQRALAEGRVSASTDLLHPEYYLAPGLTEEVVLSRLREFASRSPNWVTAEPSPDYLRLAQRLRQRGVQGPIWSYFSTLQRLWPRGDTPTSS